MIATLRRHRHPAAPTIVQFPWKAHGRRDEHDRVHDGRRQDEASSPRRAGSPLAAEPARERDHAAVAHRRHEAEARWRAGRRRGGRAAASVPAARRTGALDEGGREHAEQHERERLQHDADEDDHELVQPSRASSRPGSVVRPRRRRARSAESSPEPATEVRVPDVAAPVDGDAEWARVRRGRRKLGDRRRRGDGRALAAQLGEPHRPVGRDGERRQRRRAGGDRELGEAAVGVSGRSCWPASRGTRRRHRDPPRRRRAGAARVGDSSSVTWPSGVMRTSLFARGSVAPHRAARVHGDAERRGRGGRDHVRG